MKKKKDIRQKLIEETLGRIRRYLASNYGATADLQRRFSKATKQPIYRSRLQSWFHADADKRESPGLGNFLILERVFSQMEKEKGTR